MILSRWKMVIMNEEDEDFSLNPEKVRTVDQLILSSLWVLVKEDAGDATKVDWNTSFTVPIDTWAGSLPDMLLKLRKDIAPEIVEGIRGNSITFLKCRNKELDFLLKLEHGCLVLAPAGKALALLCAVLSGLEDGHQIPE